MKTNRHFKSSIILFVLGALMFPCFLYAAKPHKPGDAHTIYITLKLKGAAAISIKKAALKYNKHLALSFTLDDGYRSAYLTAFPLLNGGQISGPSPDEWKNDEGGDGSYSKGLFYSDGCNHNIPFKLATAINAANITDLPVNRGHLSWPEVTALYNAGWDMLNHGFHHATRHGTDFNNEVQQNILAVQKQLNFTMTQFVVPGGPSDPGYEHDYEKAAFKYGNNAVASIGGTPYVISVFEPVNLSNMVFQRDFMQSIGDSVNFTTANNRLKVLDSLMKEPKTIWFNEFTHGTGNSNLWSLSLRFPEFKYYMTAIANRYGVTGSDNIWMAPWQEVYEYIWLRDRIKLSTTKNGNQVAIKIQIPDLPIGFRHQAISLAVNSSSTFTVASHSSNIKVIASNKIHHQVINIEL